MLRRSRALFVSLPAVCALVFAACDDDATGGGGPSLDAGPPLTIDGAVPDTSVSTPDATVPKDAAPEASTDAGDGGDGAVSTALPFATGLDTNGAALADLQIDPHWTVRDNADAGLTAYVQTEALGYAGYWMRPSATSKFISPFLDTTDPSGSGTFTYTTTFALGPEVTLANVQLVVRYASDNQMVAILLNDQPLAGVVAGSYSTFESLTVSTGFVRGINRISLSASNSGGPTGMRAELDLTTN